jgi:hypothetical protein
MLYSFDPSKGETPETIARRRDMANLLAARMFSRAPQNVGEGINAIGQALALRGMERDADAAQKAGLAGGADLYRSAFGTPAAPSSVATPPAAATPPMGATSIPAGGTEFTNSVMPIAQAASEKTGIDPRLIVAQAALETGYGKSAPGNNLFGIKSHGQPGGNVLPTTEVVNGQPVRTTDSFAAYASPADSANGYADFINKNPRYAPLKAAQGLEAQAAALGQSGYATDPNYGQKVLQIARGLPAPTGGVLADNSPSPLDNAQYPAGPVGAPTAAADGSDGAALPINAQPTGGALPTAQAVQAASQPQTNPRLLQLQQVMGDPRFAFFSKGQQAMVAQEYKQLLEQQQKAADPMYQAQLTKAQRDVVPIGAPFKDADGNLVQKDASGKVTVLNPADKSPTSVLEYKYYRDNFQPTPDQKAPMDYATWSTAKARAGAMTVNNNIGGGSDKQIFDTFAENTKEARSAATGLVALRNAKQALQGPGGAITGFGADERLTLQKLGSFLGVADPASIQNTETFRAAIAPQVASMLKATVGTNQISNSDREFAEKAAGGSIKLDAGSINRLLGIMETAGMARLKLHQQQLDAVYPDPEKNKRERALFSVTVPEAAQPPATSAAPASIQDGAVIVNPKTGERRVRQNGQWVPLT